MSIISILIEERKKAKINQKSMAKLLKISPESLNRFEKENRKQNINVVIDYAEIIGFELRLLKK